MNMRGTSVSPADLAFMTDELKTAVALDPDFADAYMQLAYAQSRTGDVPSAVVSAKKAISLNPRNQGYYFNLANLFMQQRKMDDALGIFHALAKSSDPSVAQRASAAALQIENIQTMMTRTDDGPRTETSDGEPVTARLQARPVATVPSATVPSVPNAQPQAALKFLKGTIVSVDCNSAPAATLTVASAGKNWTMQVRDSHHVLVMGANGFSCSWSKQKVALNYRETGESAGSVVTIEIQ